MPLLRCNNVDLFYTESGSGPESIIFSHGLLFNHHQWDMQVAHFEKNYRCITYDHRGQGESELTGNLDMDTLFEDVASLAGQLSPEKPFHFVGLSMVDM
jgi:3-oxoadipate enol-lactonase